MVLAEKIALLRRQQGWSQEDLAVRLDVSRQAVSKWEGGSSVPDLDRVLKMSELFGVSTDYLLKDALERADGAPPPAAPAAAPAIPEAEPLPQVTRVEAGEYLALVARLRRRLAAGVGLFVLCPTPLLLLAVWSEHTALEQFGAGVGLIALLVLVALGLLLVIPAGMQLEPYEWLEKEPFVLDEGAAVQIAQLRADAAPGVRRDITLGVVLCVLAVVPLFVAMALDAPDFFAVLALDVLLGVIAVALQWLIPAGMTGGAYDKLLQTGDYTPGRKCRSHVLDGLSGAYWCGVTALYLWLSFSRGEWGETAVIWVVAGVLYGGLACLLHTLPGRRAGR